MKRLFFTLLCCLTASWCFANDGDNNKYYKYKQEKQLVKTFDVQPYCELEMDGCHSDFIIKTWDQPQISFEVKVLVSSDNENKMLQKFNEISVVFKQDENKIEAETVFENHSNSKFNGTISIKYFVKVPADVRMDLETKYGDIVVENVNKDFKADVSYGNITVANLLADNKIDLKYSDITITYAKNLELEMKYSNAKIGKVEFIDAEIKYSDFTAKEITRGVFKNQYSDLKIGKINDIKSINQYSDIKIANLTQKIDINAQYSDLTATLNCTEPFVKINGEYSDIKLIINEKASFNYNIKTGISGDIICGEIMGSNAGIYSTGHIAGRRGEGPFGKIEAELMYGDIRIE